MEILIVLIFGGLLFVLPIWLIFRVVTDKNRIDNLTHRLHKVEAQVIRLENEKTTAPAAAPVPEPEPAPFVPPVVPVPPQPAAPPAPKPIIPPLSTPPPLPAFARATASEFVPALIAPPLTEPAPPIETSRAAEPPPLTPPPLPEKSSFEMRLGTYWFVRLGAVMVLTGLAFFGNLAFQNFGPAGKAGLLYAASALLLGLGAWWQRQTEKPALRNYAQVLFAGGLAAVYFTTYAAHHLAPLRIIASPTLDGILLLAWAGFMAWFADRRKSEVLALFAVGLAYYTSAITRVGEFTLYSNLLLTIVTVVFLVRNRWAGLSFASLVATYAGYGFWRFFGDNGWRWASPDEGLWFGAAFLISYWLAFTAATFLSRAKMLSGELRSVFLTLNNGAFYVLFLLTMRQVDSGKFWLFSLIFGSALLGLAAVAKKFLPAEPLAKNSYLTQGLLLVTLGFIAKYTGLKLALVLGVESVTLYILGTQRKSLILQIGGFLAAGLAVGWAVDGLEKFDPPTMWMGAWLGGLMLVNAVWAHRQTATRPSFFRPEPGYFSLLALAAGLATIWHNTPAGHFPLALAVVAAILTLSIYVLRVRELTLLAQGYLLLAQFIWLVRSTGLMPDAPWWQPALIIGISLGLSHWWQRQQVLTAAKPLHSLWQGLYALAIVGVLYFWVKPFTTPPEWLALAAGLAVGITAYGVVTRAWWLAAAGQFFLLVSAGQFALQLTGNEPHWLFPLAPIAALGLLSAATVRWFASRPDHNAGVRDPLLVLATLYRWVALVLSVWWVCKYAPAAERSWILMALACAVFALAGWRRNREALLFTAAYAFTGLWLLWFRPDGAPLLYLPNLLAILALLTLQQTARRLPDRFNLPAAAHNTVVIVGCATLWWFLSRWVTDGGKSYLTTSWSVLALFLLATGIVLRERMYRWAGLAILATALGRVVLFDVWRQATIYRVLTFMALGVVLLVLGFIYNKFQETIRKWL